jgi:iron(III) transport system substrate-binding protein
MRTPIIASVWLLMVFCLITPVFSGGAPEQKNPAALENSLWTAENYNYEKLVEAAKKEGTLTVRWHSGRVPDSAKAFEAAYGIKVVATGRFDDAENVELLRRETEANNVQVDVLTLDDKTLITDFIRSGIVVSWTPPDLASRITDESKNPQIYLYQPVVLGYNPDVYKTSPVTNLWELTEEKWRGRVAICDPNIQTYMWHLFSGAIDKADDFAKAYRDYYGKPLVTQEKNAGWEWAIRMFKNNMLSTQHDTEVAKAIGSPGQKNPPVGFFTMTRFRDAQEQNLHLAFDPNVKPYIGFALPTHVIIPAKAPHPNAARLWVRWVLTQEGHKPWSGVIGGFSPNIDVKPADNPVGGWDQWVKRLIIYDAENSIRNRQELSDLYLINRQK